jgi:hypothetical protein
MYLDEDIFHRVIDIGVKSIVRGSPVVFVRISGHAPSSFDNAWNSPRGSGPFEIIEPFKIDIID